MNPLYIIAAVLAFRAIQKKKDAPAVIQPGQGSDIERPGETAKGGGAPSPGGNNQGTPPTGAGGEVVTVILPDGTEIDQVVPL
jgi:hypothetical protein